MVESSYGFGNWLTGEATFQLAAVEDPSRLNLTLAPVDYQVLLDELVQAKAIDREQVNRIDQLEQALDQTLLYLEELRLQLKDQNTLENQLVTTEEYSHVQQQAIVRLKLQLAEQQQILDTQILETQQRDQAIQELMATIEAMTQAQQQEIERLRSYLAQDQVEVQNHRHLLEQQIQELQSALESRQQRVTDLEAETLAARSMTATLREQLATAQQQIKELSVRLRQYQVNWAQLEARLEAQLGAQLEAKLEAQQERTQASRSSVLSLPLHRSTDTHGSSVAQDLTRAQLRIEALESQLAQQAQQAVRWQQSQQQLEEERDHLQFRVTTLEQQSAEMQEQILHQAQQATEYETAVQYWKDRYAANQRSLGHLREIVEQALAQQTWGSEANTAVTEFLNTVLSAIPADSKDTSSNALSSVVLPRFTTPELPDFLVRRRQKMREQGMGTKG